MVETQEDIDEFVRESLGNCLPFLSIIYIALCKATFQPFFCKEMIGNKAILIVAPAVLCWEGAHWGLVVTSCFAIVLYVVGIPATVYVLLRHGVMRHKLSNPNWLAVLGYYYKKYKTKFVYWELVILLRRFSLTFISVVFVQLPQTQCFLGALFALTSLVAQFAAQPFQEVGLNVLDCVCNASILLYMIGAIFYLDLDLSTENRDGYEIIIIVLSACELGLCAYLIASEIHHHWLFDQVAGTLTQALIGAAHDIGQNLGSCQLDSIRRSLSKIATGEGEIVRVSEDGSSCRIRFDSGELRDVPTSIVLRDMRVHLGRLKIVHHISQVRVGLRIFHPDEYGVTLPAFSSALGGDPLLAEAFFILGNRNQDKTLELDELDILWQIFGEREIKVSPLHMLSRLAPAPLQPPTPRPKTSTVTGTKMLQRRRSSYAQQRKLLKQTEHTLFDVAKESIDLLSEALSASALRKWLLAPDRTVREMGMYLCAGAWIGVSLRGDALTSAYARHPIAHLFRGLVQAQPWLIDAISTFPDENVRALREILLLLERYTLRRSDTVSHPPLHRMLNEHARPGILHWIIHHASVEQRTTFSDVLHSIYTCNHAQKVQKESSKHHAVLHKQYNEKLSKELGFRGASFLSAVTPSDNQQPTSSRSLYADFSDSDGGSAPSAADRDAAENFLSGRFGLQVSRRNLHEPESAYGAEPGAEQPGSAMEQGKPAAPRFVLSIAETEAKDDEIARLKSELARYQASDLVGARVQIVPSPEATEIEYLRSLNEALMDQCEAFAKQQAMMRGKMQQLANERAEIEYIRSLNEALMDQCEALAKQQAMMRGKMQQLANENAALHRAALSDGSAAGQHGADACGDLGAKFGLRPDVAPSAQLARPADVLTEATLTASAGTMPASTGAGPPSSGRVASAGEF
jgi:hypothetical protein